MKVHQERWRGVVVVIVNGDRYTKIEGKQLPDDALGLYGVSEEDRQGAIKKFLAQNPHHWEPVKYAPGRDMPRMIGAAK